MLHANSQLSGPELTELINKNESDVGVYRISVQAALDIPDAIRQQVWGLYFSNMENSCVCWA